MQVTFYSCYVYKTDELDGFDENKFPISYS